MFDVSISSSSVNKSSRNQNGSLLLACAAALPFAGIPLIVYWSSLAHSLLISAVIVSAAYSGLAVLHNKISQKRIANNKNQEWVNKLSTDSSSKRLTILLAITYTDFLLFVWSTKFINIAVAWILLQVCNTLYFKFPEFIQSRVTKESLKEDSKRYEGLKTTRNKSGETGLFILLFAGIIVLIVSQLNYAATSDISSWARVLFGMFLALTAGILTAFRVCLERHVGILVTNRIPISNGSHDVINPEVLQFYLGHRAGILFTSVFAPFAILSIVVGFDTLSEEAVLGSLIVAFLIFFGNVGFFKAAKSEATTTTGLISFSIPVISLALLLLIVDIRPPELVPYIVGSCAIIVTNILLHIDPEGTSKIQRYPGSKTTGIGFNTFIISLWLAGTVILFRDRWLPSEWIYPQGIEYWSMLAVCATVFILIFSFRINRIHDTTKREDELSFELHRRGELYARAGIFNCCKDTRNCCVKVKPIDLSSNTDISTQERPNPCVLASIRELNREPKIGKIRLHYLNTRKIIWKTYEDIEEVPPEDFSISSSESRFRILGGIHERLVDFQIQLDTLANHRQSGRDFTEISALTVLAAVTVFVALVVNPHDFGTSTAWASLVTEFVAILFASSIIFLVFNLWEWRKYRDSEIIRQVSEKQMNEYNQPSGWRLNFWTYKDLTKDRAISVILWIMILAMFFILLYNKWFWS